MCRFSRRVQDFYCSVQNVQDKQSVVQRCFEPKFCTQRASCTLRKKRHMTDQQIYFSGWTGFVHTCLGLICQFRILFRFALLPEVQCTIQKGWHENFVIVQWFSIYISGSKAPEDAPPAFWGVVTTALSNDGQSNLPPEDDEKVQDLANVMFYFFIGCIILLVAYLICSVLLIIGAAKVSLSKIWANVGFIW